MMEMCGGGDNYGIEPKSKQRFVVSNSLDTQSFGDLHRMRTVRIGNRNEFNAGNVGKHTRMVRAHNANADNAKTKLAGRNCAL
jgi:hypothetical protein